MELPVFYGNKMRRKIKAGAGCEDLRVRCPYYYTVAAQAHAAMTASLTADEAFPAFILGTFRGRYKARGRRCAALRCDQAGRRGWRPPGARAGWRAGA